MTMFKLNKNVMMNKDKSHLIGTSKLRQNICINTGLKNFPDL